MKQKNLKIIHYVDLDNIINGTLFYSYEHLLEILYRDYDCELWLINSSEAILKKITNIFLEKYNTNNFSKIKNVSKIQILKEKIDNALILSEATLLQIKEFTKNINVFLYSNSKILEEPSRPRKNISSDNFYKGVKSYGFYNYQNWENKTELKLAFKFMKKITPKYDKSFISFVHCEQEKINSLVSQYTYKYPYIIKNSVKHNNLFENKEICYIHTTLDRNNRLIPECKFMGINVKVLNDPKNDSIIDRITRPYTDFEIDDDYILLKDFVG